MTSGFPFLRATKHPARLGSSKPTIGSHDVISTTARGLSCEPADLSQRGTCRRSGTPGHRAAAAGDLSLRATRLVESEPHPLSRSGRHRPRLPLSSLPRREHSHQASLHRNRLGRGTRVERSRPLPGLERHPEQPAASLDCGRRPGDRVSQPVGLQQREHLRLRGPPGLLRARGAPCGALRAVRRSDGHRRFVRGQAAELAQRRCGPPRR